MVETNSILNEYNSQTKSADIMFSLDDFWLGALFGTWFGGGGDTSGSGWNCCCCIGCAGCCACVTGNLGTWLCGVKDCACGACSLCTSICSVGPDYDAGEAGADQCCDGLCNMFCF